MVTVRSVTVSHEPDQEEPKLTQLRRFAFDRLAAFHRDDRRGRGIVRVAGLVVDRYDHGRFAE